MPILDRLNNPLIKEGIYSNNNGQNFTNILTLYYKLFYVNNNWFAISTNHIQYDVYEIDAPEIYESDKNLKIFSNELYYISPINYEYIYDELIRKTNEFESANKKQDLVEKLKFFQSEITLSKMNKFDLKEE